MENGAPAAPHRPVARVRSGRSVRRLRPRRVLRLDRPWRFGGLVAGTTCVSARSCDTPGQSGASTVGSGRRGRGNDHVIGGKRRCRHAREFGKHRSARSAGGALTSHPGSWFDGRVRSCTVTAHASRRLEQCAAAGARVQRPAGPHPRPESRLRLTAARSKRHARADGAPAPLSTLEQFPSGPAHPSTSHFFFTENVFKKSCSSSSAK